MNKKKYVDSVAKFRHYINKAEDIVVIIDISILSIVVFLQVFFRYVLNAPLAWSEELARYLFIWLVYLASAVVLRDDSHMSMDYFINLFPSSIRIGIDIFGKFVISLFLLVGIRESFTVVNITMMQTSPSLDIPMGFIYAALPVSFFLMLLDFATRIILHKRQGDKQQ